MNKQNPKQKPHIHTLLPKIWTEKFSPAGQLRLPSQYKAPPTFFPSPILPSTRDPTLQISTPRLPHAILPIMAGGPGQAVSR